MVSISHWLDPNCAHRRAWLIGWLTQRRVGEHVAWPCLSGGLSQRDLLFWLLNGDVGLWSVPFLLNRWSLRPFPVLFVPPGGSLLLTLFIPTGGSLFLNAITLLFWFRYCIGCILPDSITEFRSDACVRCVTLHRYPQPVTGRFFLLLRATHLWGLSLICGFGSFGDSSWPFT